MLVIRKEQMAVLKAHMLKVFEDRMLRQMRNQFPDQVAAMTDQQLRRLVQMGISKGAPYHLEQETDLARLIILMLREGEDFDQKPDMAWTRYYLAHEEMPGASKLDLIEHRLTKEAQPHA